MRPKPRAAAGLSGLALLLVPPTACDAQRDAAPRAHHLRTTELATVARDNNCSFGSEGCYCLDGQCSGELVCGDDYICGPPEATCGNGVLEVGEGCDDGNLDPSDACTEACQPARCGDDRLWAGVELCDDGNRDPHDACTNDCQPGQCGDGVLMEDELCDDGNAVDDDYCANDCTRVDQPGWMETWTGPQGTTNYDIRAHDLGLTPEGDIIMAGDYGVSGASERGFLRKYLPDGTPVWTISHGELDVDVTLRQIAVSADGLIAATGTKSAEDERAWVGLFDADGQLLWEREVSAPMGDAFGGAVAWDASGDLWAAGGRTPEVIENDDDSDAWIERYDVDGELLTEHVADLFNYSEVATSIRPLPDGGYYLNGTLAWGDGNQDRLLLRRYDADGELVWYESWWTTCLGHAWRLPGLEVAANGDLIAVGVRSLSGFGTTGPSGLAARLTPTHGWRWTTFVTAPINSWEHLADLVLLPDGGFVAAGTVDRDDLQERVNLLQVGFDDAGNVLWRTEQGEPDVGLDESASAIVRLDDGTLVVAGYASGPGLQNAWIRSFEP